METTRETSTATLTVDNRTQPRRQPSPMAYVEVGAGNGGLLLNLSEGGLALQAAHVLRESSVTLRFRLAEYPNEIEVTGEVVWLAASDKRAGVHFVDLSPAVRQAIRDWVSGVSHETVTPEAVQSKRQPPARAGVERYASLEPRRDKSETGPEAATLLLERARRLIDAQSAGLDRTASNGPRGSEAGYGRLHSGGTPAPITGTPAGYKKWSSQKPAEKAVEQSQSFVEPEVKLPEVAWWVEPEKPRRPVSSITLLFILTLALAFAAGALGFWQPGAVLQKLGLTHLSQFFTDSARPAASKPSNAEQPPVNPGAQNPGAAAGSSPDAKAEGGSESSEPAANDDGRTSTPDDTETQPGANSRPSDSSTPPASGASGSHSTSGPAAGASSRIPPSPVRPKPASPSKADARKDFPPAAASGGTAMLVRPPEPGSLPMVLSLPEQTIGATGYSAVTSRRGVRISPAQTRAGAMQPVRVTVGRLLTRDTFFDGSDSVQDGGTVEIVAKVGIGGEVIETKTVSGAPRLVASVVHTIRQWRYEPTLIDGRPVESEDEIRVIFRTH